METDILVVTEINKILRYNHFLNFVYALLASNKCAF